LIKLITNIALSIVCLLHYSGQAQDYSKKPISSIHNYAERLLGAKIVEKKGDMNIREAKLFYYKKKDLGGQYVHISGEYSGDYYLAMWKMKDGRDVVVITHYRCEAWCNYEMSCYAFTKTDSTEVSTEVFPLKKMVKQLNKMRKKVLIEKDLEDKSAQYKFILGSGQGLMKVYISMDHNKIEFPILDLSWNGNQFQVSTRYKEVPDL
jgi:hypothetical protein